MSNHSTLSIPKSLLNKIAEDYHKMYSINPLSSGRNKKKVISRQCLSLILKDTFLAGVTDISRLMNCDHSTVIYSNKKADEQLGIMSKEYINAVNNWKEVFSLNGIDIRPQKKYNLIKNRIIAVMQNGIDSGLVKKNQLDELLKEALECI